MFIKAWGKIDEYVYRKLRVAEETEALHTKANMDAQKELTRGCAAVKEESAKAGTVEMVKEMLGEA
jgi:hypothetical protein